MIRLFASSLTRQRRVAGSLFHVNTASPSMTAFTFTPPVRRFRLLVLSSAAVILYAVSQQTTNSIACASDPPLINILNAGETLHAESPADRLTDVSYVSKGGHYAVMQKDCNFVLYQADGKPIWATNTWRDQCITSNVRPHLAMQEDNNLVIYVTLPGANARSPIWASDTHGHGVPGGALILTPFGRLHILDGNREHIKRLSHPNDTELY